MTRMAAIHVVFTSPATAYEFLSEIRRQSASLLWDTQVHQRDEGADVVIPRSLWDREPFIASVAETYGGDVRAESSLD